MNKILIGPYDTNGVAAGEYTHKEYLQAVLDKCPEDVTIDLLRQYTGSWESYAYMCELDSSNAELLIDLTHHNKGYSQLWLGES